MAIQTVLPYDINQRNDARRAASSISQTLEGLVSNHLQKMQSQKQQANQARAYIAAGIPQEQAGFLSSADPQTQQLILKNYLQAAQGSGLDQALAELGGQQSPNMQPQSIMQNTMGALQSQPQDMVMRNLMQGLGQQQLQQEFPQQMNQQVQQQKPELTQLNENNLANVLQRPRLSPQHKLKIEEMKQRKEFHKEKLNAAQQKDVDKETLPTYHEVNKSAKAAKDSNIRLGRMEELINRGKLTDTAFYNGIKALGKLPGIGGFIESIAESFLSPDTQEFEKLSTDFIKDAKQFFGNRITQQEVMLFLKTVPNLSQTNPGKKRVVRNMRIFNEASELRKKSMDKLIKANGGKRPNNLEALIEQEVSPQLDALAEQFKGSAAS